MTVSQPASVAFIFRSPCRCERKPMIETDFFNLVLNFGNQRQRLGVQVVQIEDQQRGAFVFGSVE